MADAVGLAAELDEPPVVDDAVDHGGSHLVVPEHRPPPAKLQVRGDYHRLPLVSVGEDLEEQPRPVRVEREKPELVDDEQAGLADERGLPVEPPVVAGAPGLATLMWTVPGGAQETGGPYMRDPRHPRHFTDEFKRQIVDLYNAGKPKREAMDEYDLGKSTVERWIKSINATGSPRAADNRTPEQNRILELERENRRLRMEVDVLKQAAPIYARK